MTERTPLNPPTNDNLDRNALPEASLKELAKYGVTAEHAAKMGIQQSSRVTTDPVLDVTAESIYIPRFYESGTENGYARTWVLETQLERGGSIPAGFQDTGPPSFYFSRGIDWEHVVLNTSDRLFIAWDEFSAATANYSHDLLTLGVTGLKGVLDELSRATLLTECSRIVWTGREVVIPSHTNQLTPFRLAACIQRLGGRPTIVHMPEVEDETMTLGEYLVGHEKKQFEALTRQPPDAHELLAEPHFGSTDTGYADAFVMLYGKNLKYNHAKGSWLTRTKSGWASDRTGTTFLLSKEFARNVLRGVELVPYRRRKRAISAAKKIATAGKLTTILKCAAMEPPIVNDGSGWDTNPMLLGALNGIIDLDTGELRQATPSDMITKSVATPYNPEAKCPRFEKFLDEVFVTNDGQPDKKLREHVLRAFGYSLTAKTNEQLVFLCQGNGANGKSKLLEIFRRAAGEYGHQTPLETLVKKSGKGLRVDISAIEGNHLVIATESNEEDHWDSATVKTLTGGDAVTAREPHRSLRTFTPKATIWLGTNHLPIVDDTSDGTRRRMQVIPFNATFSGEKDDKDLLEKLDAELEGIVALGVRSCLDWQNKGLTPPAAVIEATNQYRDKCDPVGVCIRECFDTGDGLSITGRQAYRTYEDWEADRGTARADMLSETTFGIRLKQMFPNRTRSSSTRIYHGLAPKRSVT